MSYVYISGKITGNPRYKSQFEKRASDLKSLGYLPINPVKIYERLKWRLGREPDRREIMDEDIKELKKCDYINFLDNWKNSEGAKKEHAIAKENNIAILEVTLLSRNW